MKNYVQKGETLTLTAPYAVSSGAGALVGSIFGVAATDVASGGEGEFQVAGVFDLVRETGAGTGFSQGTLIYWDDTNKRITKTATGNKLIGVAVRAAADGDATGRVRLNGAFLS
jgi:predicted RecA/RadA family phage recombinase